jgi:hypothetical protein
VGRHEVGQPFQAAAKHLQAPSRRLKKGGQIPFPPTNWLNLHWLAGGKACLPALFQQPGKGRLKAGI